MSVVFVFSSSRSGLPAAAEETSRVTRTRRGASHSLSPCTLADWTRPRPLSHHLPPDTHTPVTGQPRLLSGVAGDTHGCAGLTGGSGADAHRAHTLLLQPQWTHVSVRRAAPAAVPHHQTSPDRPPSEPNCAHVGTVHAVLQHAHAVASHGLIQEHAAAAFPCPPSFLLPPISRRRADAAAAAVTQENRSAVRRRAGMK